MILLSQLFALFLSLFNKSKKELLYFCRSKQKKPIIKKMLFIHDE